MLISFSLENWKSFKVPTRLSLADAGCPRKGRTIPKVKKYNASLLPLISIYGGNASGKSNFIEAMDFAKNLVVDGMESKNRLITKPFLLDKDSKSLPSKFKFELLIDETVYEYAFAILHNTVQNESLFKVGIDYERIPVFERDKQKIKLSNELDTEFLNNVAESTLEHHLFLRHCINFKFDSFRPVFEWFSQSLLVIGTSSDFATIDALMDAYSPIIKRINSTLFQLDTGVIGINKQKLSTEYLEALIANEIISRSELMEKGTLYADLPDGKVLVKLKDGEIIGNKLIVQHRTDSGELVDFNFNEESDGTKRLIELIPAFFGLTQNTKLEVLVINELDRSLHSRLTKNLIEKYLETCGQSTRTQLIFTTHDQSLISELPLCNDEICVADRDMDGITRIISLGDFSDIKSDDNILKLYNNGRLGGIPSILFENTAINPFDNADVNEEYIL